MKHNTSLKDLCSPAFRKLQPSLRPKQPVVDTHTRLTLSQDSTSNKYRDLKKKLVKDKNDKSSA